MKYGLGDTPQKEPAERPEASRSEDNEIDIASPRDLHNRPRRISMRHEALAATMRLVEQSSRITEDLRDLCLLPASVLVDLPSFRRCDRPASPWGDRSGKNVQQGYAAVTLDL